MVVGTTGHDGNTFRGTSHRGGDIARQDWWGPSVNGGGQLKDGWGADLDAAFDDWEWSGDVVDHKLVHHYGDTRVLQRQNG